MDWLEWAIRIAVVFGGVVFLVCAYLGAHSLITAWRIQLEIWRAKKRYYAIRNGDEAFRKHVESESE